MKPSVKCIVCGIVLAVFSTPVSVVTASELVWTPINPSFGGPSYNGQWLMASAQAQNTHVERGGSSIPTRSLMEDFQSSLNRQILYGLSRKIVDSAFGEGSLESGHYEVGDYTIDVNVDVSGINVVVTEIGTGNTTTVQVPYY